MYYPVACAVEGFQGVKAAAEATRKREHEQAITARLVKCYCRNIDVKTRSYLAHRHACEREARSQMANPKMQRGILWTQNFVDCSLP